MPITKEQYLRRAEEILVILLEQDIKLRAIPTSSSNTFINQRLSAYRSVHQNGMDSMRALCEKNVYEAGPVLTGNVATTYLKIGACQEMAQRFAFEYFKRYQEQEVALVFMEGETNEKHVFVLLGSLPINITSSNLVIGRGSNDGSINPSAAITLDAFLQQQESTCILVDALLFFCDYATQANSNNKFHEYVVTHKLNRITGIKLYHNTLNLIENISCVEENAQIIAKKIQERLPENLQFSEFTRLLNEETKQHIAQPSRAIRQFSADGKREELKLFLMQHPCEINGQSTNGKTALHWAIEKGHAACVFELLSRGARYDIADTSGKTAIDAALLESHSLISYLFTQLFIKRFLNEKISPFDSMIHLIFAPEILKKFLMSHEKDAEKALRTAAHKGDIDAVKLLSHDHSVDINSAGIESGQTALHRAVLGKHILIVTFLVNHPSSNLSKEDAKGKTAQQYAEGNEALMEIFLTKATIQLKL